MSADENSCWALACFLEAKTGGYVRKVIDKGFQVYPGILTMHGKSVEETFDVEIKGLGVDLLKVELAGLQVEIENFKQGSLCTIDCTKIA